MAELSQRLLALTGFIAACTAAWLLLRLWQQRRLRTLAFADAPSPLDGLLGAGPALLYFTTEDCSQCRFQQTPILTRLSATAAIPVVTLDAVQRQDLARHYGIMTVPSTVVLDSGRKPIAINHGVAPLHKLHSQVADLV
jgi:thioredoxin 1